VDAESRSQFNIISMKTSTICLVGNAYSLKGLGLGEAIDNHTHILRFNHYKVEGYEEDVGERTTHWSAAPEPICRLIKQEGLQYFRQYKTVWARNWGGRGRPPNQIQIAKIASYWKDHEVCDLQWLSEDTLRECGSPYRDWEEEFLKAQKQGTTTGFLALIFAMHHYKTPISIGGFGFSEYSNYDYYSGGEINRNHSLDKERLVINRWVEQGLLNRIEEE